MLLGGHINFISCGATWLPHVKAGTLRVLATYTINNRVFPDVPTLKELGYDFFDWSGTIIIGPPKLPNLIVKKLHDTFKKVIDEPRFEEVLKKMNLMEKAYRNSEELGEFLANHNKYWGGLLREMRLGIYKKD
jgi:tripartite-type tricarboxylate transporter receptor subunit TctC